MAVKTLVTAIASASLLIGCQTAPPKPTEQDIDLCRVLLDNAVDSLNEALNNQLVATSYLEQADYEMILNGLVKARTFFQRGERNINMLEQYSPCGQIDMTVEYPSESQTFAYFRDEFKERSITNDKYIADAQQAVQCNTTAAEISREVKNSKELLESAVFQEELGLYQGSVTMRRQVNKVFLKAATEIDGLQSQEFCGKISVSVTLNGTRVFLPEYEALMYNAWMTNSNKIDELNRILGPERSR